MRNPENPLVVFDLDGTLADTALDLVATLNAILVGDGVPALPAERARDKIGAGGRALIARGFEAAGREITPDHLEKLYLTFLARYGDNVCVHTRLYPGVIRALDRLEADGFRFAVCTNKVESHALRLLEALGIAGRFAAICGRDTFPYLKPDPRHLTETIRVAGCDPRQAVMVGDSRTDIVTAKAAGIPAIAVSFGYSEIPVRELEPDRLIDHFDDLPAAIAGLVRVAELA